MASPEDFFLQRTAMRPTVRTWIKHLILLLVTLVTATIAGTLYPFGFNAAFPANEPQTWPELIQFLFALPAIYLGFVVNAAYLALSNAAYLAYGLSFSLSLLFILVSHEMGHYVACRLYGVDATLPYFIPTPPMFGPAGTFGAFIRIRSPMPSRKAVFDIGVAGPIAGFLALIPIAVIGIATMESVPAGTPVAEGSIVFADPLMIKLIAAAFGKDPQYGIGNAFYFAAWIGLLVTSLNLIPSGQLDGGHAIYAVLGAAVHRWTGRIAFVVMAALSIAGWFVFNSPSGFLIAVLLGVMMRVRHPEPWDQRPLDLKRKIIAVLALLIFIVCFVPFPVRLT